MASFECGLRRDCLPAALEHEANLAPSDLNHIDIGRLAELEDAIGVVAPGLGESRAVATAALIDEAVVAGAALADRRGIVAALLVDLGFVLTLELVDDPIDLQD